MSYRLFLDDDRLPAIAANYVLPVDRRKEYRLYEWSVVKNYPEFVSMIKTRGAPTHVSFDHDLYPRVYDKNLVGGILNYGADDFKSKYKRTGWHCADWMFKYLLARSLPLPICWVHSLNPDGKENIEKLINYYTIKF